MKKILFLLAFVYCYNFAYPQTNFLVKESGGSTAQNITYTKQMKFTKTSGSWNGAIFRDVQFYKVISDAIKHNTLTLNSSSVTVNHGVSMTETNTTDSWGNSKSLFNLTLPNPMTYNDFTLTLSYSLNTELNISTAFNPPITYPLSSSDTWSQQLLGYLSPTTNIESNSPEIANMASSIVSGATDLKSAVELLASWIAANISYISGSTTALQVLRSRTGNCQGQSNLMIAFCRYLGIPARIDVGDYFRYQRIIYTDKIGHGFYLDPSGNGTMTNETVGHALYEVYYPTIGWVRGDPAMTTLNFGWSTFIKTSNLKDPEDASSYYTHTSGFESTAVKTFSTSVSNFASSFNYYSTKIISGAKNNTYIYAPFDQSFGVGFYDKVTIQDPPTGTTCYGLPVSNNTNVITPCSESSFYAKFETDNNPTTYAYTFDWSIVLYHSGGEYIYAAQNGIIPNANTPIFWGESCVWKPTTGILPSYNWAYNADGTIYGLIKVIAHVSDGTTQYYETGIGVNSTKNIHDVTYSADTTVDACSELNLTNVTISSTPTIIFNTNGLGITINGTFEAPIGSTLIINE